MSGGRETAEKKPRRCYGRIFAGLFMFTSGIAMWFNIVLNHLMEAPNSDWQSVIQAIASSILILWTFGGFWLFVYGLSSPCPKPLEY